ncbi:MAG: hypothetical protein ABR582_07300 [Gemmatimonadaceae bacterium]
MNKFRIISASLLLTSVASLSACGYSSNNPTAPVTQPSNVPSFITSGTWAVSSLTQGTEDKASQLSGFNFTFTAAGSENGTVVATKGGTSVSGTWTHAPAVTYYGSSSQESIVLSLGTSSPFATLTKTWNVVSVTPTTLTLVNPEVAENMHLVFSKE